MFILAVICATYVFATPQDSSARVENKTAENTAALPAGDSTASLAPDTAAANTIKKAAIDTSKAIAAVSVAAGSVAADTSFRVKLDHSFTWAAFILTHKALRTSKKLHNYLFYPLALPVAWNSNLTVHKDFGKLVTIKSLLGGNASIMDFGLNVDGTIELMHLLELGISANIHSSFNYGDYATFMGVYNPEKRDYDSDTFMTEFAYGTKLRVGATVPLIAFLPKSNWTKIILRPEISWTYTTYTGADDGEMWKCGAEYSANGWRYRYGGTLIYFLPFQRFPMLMVNASVSSFFKSTKFDEVYDRYDPFFNNISVTPMLTVKISDKWTGMLMASFNRDRTYERYYYEAPEELLQIRKGSEWGMKVIMMTFTRKF